jgi:hypothetical protein
MTIEWGLFHSNFIGGGFVNEESGNQWLKDPAAGTAE